MLTGKSGTDVVMTKDKLMPDWYEFPVGLNFGGQNYGLILGEVGGACYYQKLVSGYSSS